MQYTVFAERKLRGNVNFFNLFSGLGAEVEEQAKAQRIIQGVPLVAGGDEVAEIESENVVLQSKARREVAPSTLGLIFVEVAGADRKLTVVPVLSAGAEGEFTQFLAESLGSVAETREYSRDGTLVIDFVLVAVGVRSITGSGDQ
jgi:hypothetical protein